MDGQAQPLYNEIILCSTSKKWMWYSRKEDELWYLLIPQHRYPVDIMDQGQMRMFSGVKVTFSL